MERSFIFNSVNGDRKYKAEDFTRYFASFIANGVFPNPSTNLQVFENGNVMSVVVGAGKAWINGYFYENTDDLVLAIDVADGALPRIDRVVLRWDVVNREIKAQVKKGAYASNPIPPDLQRDADVYELALADVYVAAGAIGITQANITDLRLNSELCGIVHGIVQQVDTTTLFNQFQSGFNEWFESIKDVLDENTAGNLYNMIQQVEATAQQASQTAQQANQTATQTASTLASHLADYTLQIPYAVDTSATAGVITVTLNPAPTAYTTGMALSVKVANAVSGATTININGLGAKPVKKPNGTDPNFTAGGVYTLRYDGTNFTLQGSGGGGTATPDKVLTGYTFTSDTLENANGAMPNNPAETKALATFTLRNLVTNGSFENGLTGWSGGVIDTANKKFGGQSAKIVSPNGTSAAICSQNVSLIAGHIYYACGWFLRTASITNGYGQEFDISNISPEMGNAGLNDTTLPNINTWYQISWRDTAPSSVTGAVIRYFNYDLDPIYADGITLIDLTATFGAGNEPTKAQMDAIMMALGGWFDGSAIISKIPTGAYITNGATGGPDILINDPNLAFGSNVLPTKVRSITALSVGLSLADISASVLLKFVNGYIYTIRGTSLVQYDKNLNQRWTYDFGVEIFQADVDTDGDGYIYVICVDNKSTHNEYFVKLNEATGAQVFKVLVQTSSSYPYGGRSIAKLGNYCYFSPITGTDLYEYDLNGNKTSKIFSKASGNINYIAPGPNGALYGFTDGNYLMKWNVSTGAVAVQVSTTFNRAFDRYCFDTSSNIYFAVGSNLIKFDANTLASSNVNTSLSANSVKVSIFNKIPFIMAPYNNYNNIEFRTLSGITAPDVKEVVMFYQSDSQPSYINGYAVSDNGELYVGGNSSYLRKFIKTFSIQ